jgi:hypothetical protein
MQRAAALLALVILAAACGGGEADAPARDPGDLVAEAADAMDSVASARFEMRRTGEPVTIQGMTFDAAVGEYAAPDAARALLDLRAGDLVLQMGTISIGERTWLTNPLTGDWDELDAGTGFNPARIFDPDLGWRPLLTEDLSDLRSIGIRDGLQVVGGTVAADRVAVLTAGLVEDQAVPIEISLDPETGRIRRVEFSTQGESGETTWVIELSGYDEPVTVEPPSAG